MAKVLCIGCPYIPPIIHGHAFEPDEDGIHYVAEVPESDFDKFLIGVEGSPFFLETDSSNTTPPGTGAGSDDKTGDGPGADGEGSDGNVDGSGSDDAGSNTGGGSDGNTDGPDVIDAQMAEFLAASNKTVLVALAFERLGLELSKDDKVDTLRAAIREELVKRSNQ